MHIPAFPAPLGVRGIGFEKFFSTSDVEWRLYEAGDFLLIETSLQKMGGQILVRKVIGEGRHDVVAMQRG